MSYSASFDDEFTKAGQFENSSFKQQPEEQILEDQPESSIEELNTKLTTSFANEYQINNVQDESMRLELFQLSSAQNSPFSGAPAKPAMKRSPLVSNSVAYASSGQGNGKIPKLNSALNQLKHLETPKPSTAIKDFNDATPTGKSVSAASLRTPALKSKLSQVKQEAFKTEVKLSELKNGLFMKQQEMQEFEQEISKLKQEITTLKQQLVPTPKKSSYGLLILLAVVLVIELLIVAAVFDYFDEQLSFSEWQTKWHSRGLKFVAEDLPPLEDVWQKLKQFFTVRNLESVSFTRPT
jgi:hypothetical protein